MSSIGAGPAPSYYPYGFQNGIVSRGMPLLQSYPGIILWVYNGANLAPQGAAGSDGNGGQFNRPMATITGALGKCVAGRGDIIMVKAGHVEPTIAAAGGLNLNVAGVQIIGLGAGNTRPSIAFSTATTASLTVTAAQMSLVNFLIDLTGFDALATPISVSAADFLLSGCDIITANATNQTVLGVVTTAAADRLTVDGCRFRGTVDAGTTAAIQLVGGDSIQITNNFFIGGYTTTVGAINNITTACTGLLLANNVINNLTAASAKAAVFVAGSTGSISGNRVQILTGTAPFTGAAMSWVGANYYAATIATAGTLI